MKPTLKATLAQLGASSTQELIDKHTDLTTALRASEAREGDVTDKYEKFVLWVVNTLKPSGVLPGITDEAYAKQLVEGLLESESSLQKKLSTVEKTWESKVKLVEQEKAELQHQVEIMKEELDRLNRKFIRLETAINEHNEEVEHNQDLKKIIDSIKKIFKKGKNGKNNKS